MCQPTKKNLARYNCKTGRREFTPDDNEKPGPSNEPSVDIPNKRNNFLRKQRSLSGEHMHLSISATENINLLPQENDKQRSKTAPCNAGKLRITGNTEKDTYPLANHNISRAGNIDDGRTTQNKTVEQDQTELQAHPIKSCQEYNLVHQIDQRADIETPLEINTSNNKDSNGIIRPVYMADRKDHCKLDDDDNDDDDDDDDDDDPTEIGDKTLSQFSSDSPTCHVNTQATDIANDSYCERPVKETHSGTNVHRELPNDDVCGESNKVSSSITSEDRCEMNDTSGEQTILITTTPLAKCISVLSTDKEHSKRNISAKSPNALDTRNHPHGISVKEIDNSFQNNNGQYSRNKTWASIDTSDNLSLTPSELIESFEHGTCNMQVATSPFMSGRNEEYDEPKQDLNGINSFNICERNEILHYIFKPEVETCIGASATKYNTDCLGANNFAMTNTPRSSFVSSENKIVIPTDYGEESSEFDITDSEPELEIDAQTHLDDDVAELKALLELTKERHDDSVTGDFMDDNTVKIELTNGKPCKEYVQFVREKTMDTKKSKAIKKVEKKKTSQKDKISKSLTKGSTLITPIKGDKTKKANYAKHKNTVQNKKKTKPTRNTRGKKTKRNLKHT